MNLLKLKAKFYQYTGVYLANKEENDYLTSREFWKHFNKHKKHKDNDMSDYNIQRLMIGMWQADLGFHRPMTKFRTFKRLPCARLYNMLDWFACFYYTAKWDLESLWSKVKK